MQIDTKKFKVTKKFLKEILEREPQSGIASFSYNPDELWIIDASHFKIKLSDNFKNEFWNLINDGYKLVDIGIYDPKTKYFNCELTKSEEII